MLLTTALLFLSTEEKPEKPRNGRPSGDGK